MDPYGNAANQYGQEMMYGTRLQAGLDQQKAEFPNQLYDRFMQAYQQQIRQKQIDAEMARKQQHEDTYLKMAQDREALNKGTMMNAVVDDISTNYNGDPAQKAAYEAQLRPFTDNPSQFIPADTTESSWEGQPMAPDSKIVSKTTPGAGAKYKIQLAIQAAREKRDAANAEAAAKRDEERQREFNERMDRMDSRQQAGFEQQDKLLSKRQANIHVNVGGAGGSSFNDAAIDNMADEMAVSGELKNIPRGKEGAALLALVRNRFAEKYPGKNPGSVRADYAANKGSQTKLQTTSDAVTAYEDLANQNFTQLVDAAKKIPDTGSPLLNSPLRKGAKTLTGSTAVNDFEILRQTTLNEVARVVNNPNLVGILSDSARKEIEDLLSPGATRQQVQSAHNIFKAEMSRRAGALSNKLKETQTRRDAGVVPADSGDERKKALAALARVKGNAAAESAIRNEYKKRNGEDL